MSVYRGDFLGFSIGGIHSSSLNITRVSNNGMYNESLIPNFTDLTAAAPGRDGTYYWNTNYNSKPITIDFAFDNLSEYNLRRLKQIFGFKGVQELIFDEDNTKKYMVKCSSPPTLRYVAFNDGEFTIYKGDGTINLVALYPYALSLRENELIWSNCINNILQIDNIGDIDMPIKIIYAINKSTVTLSLKINGLKLNEIKIANLSKQGNDVWYCIDMETHLIEGLNSQFQKTGHLYNKFIVSGDFFNIPLGMHELESTAEFKKVKYYTLYY